jgi:pimeloyl-ACP methyl ester carboxylesterase
MPHLKLPDGVSLYYEIDGNADVESSKPWMVLSHGYGSDTTSFRELMPFLIPHFRILRWDHRGHGRSDKPKGTSHEENLKLYTMHQLALDLKNLLDGLNITPDQRIILYGHSMGGMVAQQFAVIYPNYLYALILGSTAPQNNNAPMHDMVRRYKTGETPLTEETFRMNAKVGYSRKYLKEHPDIIEESVRRKMAVGPDILLALIDNFVYNYNVEAQLPKLKVPTLILVGDRDGTIYFGQSKRIHELIPNSHIIIYPNMSHAINAEIPEQLVHDILNFLNSIM